MSWRNLAKESLDYTNTLKDLVVLVQELKKLSELRIILKRHVPSVVSWRKWEEALTSSAYSSMLLMRVPSGVGWTLRAWSQIFGKANGEGIPKRHWP